MIIKFLNKFACTLVISTMCIQSVAAQVLDKVIAVVNSDVISQYELDNYSKFALANLEAQGDLIPTKDILNEQLLSRLILDKIQLQLAEQTGIEVDSITVTEAVQHLARQKGLTLDELKSSIEQKGLPFEDYRAQVRSDLIIQRLQAREVARDVIIAKSDIENYLSSAAGQDHSGTEYRMSHILILSPEAPTPEALKQVQSKAENLVNKLQNGADFQKMAMTHSAGRQALSGGDLGWRSSGEMPTIFANYIPTMQVGDVVGPIRSSGGFHIIKLTGKRITKNEKDVETHVRQILIVPDNHTSSKEAQKTLQTIKQQVINGSDFAKIAQKKSQDLRSAAKGGDVGWVTQHSVLPTYFEQMCKLRNNEISEPFQTEEGWYLIQVLDRRTQMTSNEAAWNKAFEVLTMRKTNEAIEAWTKRIRDEARVQVLPSTKDAKHS